VKFRIIVIALQVISRAMGGLYVPFEVLLAKKNTHAAALAKQVDDLNKFLHYNSHLLDQDKLKELEETVS
jgi:hypothetical protein